MQNVFKERQSPAEQTSDQCSAWQCWAGSLDFLESAAEIRRPAGKHREKFKTE